MWTYAWKVCHGGSGRAVVTKEVPDFALVAGVSARMIGKVDEYGNVISGN